MDVATLSAALADVAGESWRKPLVHWDDEERTGLFEWWCGKRKLSVDFTADSDAVEYLKVWGPDIDTEMLGGCFYDAADFAPLWAWLMDGAAR